MIGRRFGRFRVVSKLGAGGMAVVWRAEDELLRRPVALKILTDSGIDAEESRRRFVRSARTGALLDHPGIPAIFDTGESDGFAWIAMALVEGQTLSERVAQRLMPVPGAVHVIGQVAAALAHAHGRGVIHRDISGRNVMIGRDGRVFLLDFGLALAQGMSRLTSTNQTMGTVAYIAPEVALGHAADPRSDLYSLGVVFFEALTGGFPFRGDRAETVLFESANRPPLPPTAMRPEIPAALERIVLKAIARDPAARFQHAEDFAAALAEFERSLPAPGEDARPESLASAAPSGVQPDARTAELPSSRGDDESLESLGTAEVPAPLYLAVLPFEDAGDASGSSPPGAGAFAHGLAEAIGAALARAERLHVVPAEAAAERAGGDLQRLARSLGANRILRGSLRRSGSRVRLAWSLIEPRRGVQLTGGTLDGSSIDLFDLEDQLVVAVCGALGVSPVGPGEIRRTRPRDPAARERYLQALGSLQRSDNEGSVDGAIGLLERLIETEGDRAEYLAALARACLAKYRLTASRTWEIRAQNACARALEIQPDDPEVLVTLAEVRVNAGAFPEAIEACSRALALRPDSLEAHLALARAQLAAGRFEDAESACRRAIALRPRDWRGYNRLGMVLFTQGHYARAVEPWRRVVRLTPDNASGHLNLGTAYFHLDRLDDAAHALERSLAIRPSARAYSSLGTIRYFQGDFERAVESFERAASLSPADPMYWGNLGCACVHHPGRAAQGSEALARAVELMTERLERNPNDAEGRAHMATWLGDLGRADEARSAIERAVASAPENVHCLVAAGSVYFQLGEREAALCRIEEAVRRGYGREALRRSVALAGLRADPEFQRIVGGASQGAAPGAGSPQTEG